jgi:hypothetical protein
MSLFCRRLSSRLLNCKENYYVLFEIIFFSFPVLTGLSWHVGNVNDKEVHFCNWQTWPAKKNCKQYSVVIYLSCWHKCKNNTEWCNWKLPLLKLWCMTNVSGSLVCPIFRVLGKRTLKMGQTSDPETLVIHQKLTPGNNPNNFKQQYWMVFKMAREWDNLFESHSNLLISLSYVSEFSCIACLLRILIICRNCNVTDILRAQLNGLLQLFGARFLFGSCLVRVTGNPD